MQRMKIANKCIDRQFINFIQRMRNIIIIKPKKYHALFDGNTANNFNRYSIYRYISISSNDQIRSAVQRSYQFSFRLIQISIIGAVVKICCFCGEKRWFSVNYLCEAVK